jgi:hypothetical protein
MVFSWLDDRPEPSNVTGLGLGAPAGAMEEALFYTNGTNEAWDAVQCH